MWVRTQGLRARILCAQKKEIQIWTQNSWITMNSWDIGWKTASKLLDSTNSVQWSLGDDFHRFTEMDQDCSGRASAWPPKLYSTWCPRWMYVSGLQQKHVFLLVSVTNITMMSATSTQLIFRNIILLQNVSRMLVDSPHPIFRNIICRSQQGEGIAPPVLQPSDIVRRRSTKHATVQPLDCTFVWLTSPSVFYTKIHSE